MHAVLNEVGQILLSCKIPAVNLHDTVDQSSPSHKSNNDEWLLILHGKDKLIGKILSVLNCPLG